MMASVKFERSNPGHCRSTKDGKYLTAYHQGDKFCGYCGAAMDWTCPDGHVVPLWASHCTFCGKAKA
jgi:hypothetical protein